MGEGPTRGPLQGRPPDPESQLPLAHQILGRNRCGCSGETEARQANGGAAASTPFSFCPQVVEDERSDREETDNSEEEEEVAKNGPLSNGHPVLNNNHRKTD